MRAIDVDRFVGMDYCPRTFDCADFVVLVERELFGREVRMPSDRPRGGKGQLALGELSQAYARKTDSPKDGDLVLMQDGSGWHAGVYLFLAHEPHVLHCRAEGGGHSVAQRLREVPLRIEGIYAWI